MEFILMRLSFPEDEPARGNEHPIKLAPAASDPVFSKITVFMTIGVVMNVFLLDPPGRLLASFIWVSGPNTIGLHALLDWGTQEYVYIDTGIECVSGHPKVTCVLFANILLSATVVYLVLYTSRGPDRHSFGGG